MQLIVNVLLSLSRTGQPHAREQNSNHGSIFHINLTSPCLIFSKIFPFGDETSWSCSPLKGRFFWQVESSQALVLIYERERERREKMFSNFEKLLAVHFQRSTCKLASDDLPWEVSHGAVKPYSNELKNIWQLGTEYVSWLVHQIIFEDAATT